MFIVDDIFNSIVNAVNAGQNNQMNWMNYEESKRVNEQNYQFQKSVFDYNKSQADITRSREDNAVQRKVADLRAAGLSPVLAAGSGSGSASMPVLTAPQQQYTPRQHNQAPTVNIESVMNAMKMKADIARSEAETENINLQNQKNKYDFDWYKNRNIPTSGNAMSNPVSAITSTPGFVAGAAKELADKMPKGVKEALKMLDMWLPEQYRAK